MRNIGLLPALLVFIAGYASAGEIVGVPRIVDGDTVQIGTHKIRLEGVDAPETEQICLNANRQSWKCGIKSRNKLVEQVGKQTWICTTKSVDHYGRAIAKCQTGGLDINRWLVKNGWALSFVRYSRDYDAEEKSARNSKAGLWSGAFIAPWEWRSRNTKTTVLGSVSVPVEAQSTLLASSDNPPDPLCSIKANLAASNGCIYHLPSGHYYAKLKMTDTTRRRWFCSENEAQAAGCRLSKR